MIISDSSISMSSGRKFMKTQGVKLEFDGTNSFLLTSDLERETTGFQSKGQVNTTDGRHINMDISLLMQRSSERLVSQRTLSFGDYGNALMDPLVINTGQGITRISDQKFLFDLDFDGKEDSISTLGQGAGFLAYDRNEDGVINNGLELFGALTGDGFGELSEHDGDGNGWIDEADPIFSKLKVWYKNDDGTDELVSLKDAGIGAIYLGNVETEFSEIGENGLNGVIRNTGFFLGEDGNVGTVMHIDLAISNPEGVNEPDRGDLAGFGLQNEMKPVSVIGVSSPKTKRQLIDYIENLRIERKKLMEQQLAKTKEKRRERAYFFRDLITKKYLNESNDGRPYR